MKLYKIKNGLGEWYVLAEHPTEAEEKLVTLLNETDYGFLKDRPAENIELIATEAGDKRFITGHFLLT